MHSWMHAIRQIGAPGSSNVAVASTPCQRLHAIASCCVQQHWWGAGLGEAGCHAFGRIAEAKASHANFRSLHNVLLGGNDIGDECMSVIARLAARGLFKELRALGLSRNKISDAGCLVLAKSLGAGSMPNLRDLFLSANRRLGDACFGALGGALAASTGPRHFQRLSAGDLPAVSADGLIRLLTSLRADATALGGYRGAPELREISVKNLSSAVSVCRDSARRTELITAIGGLAQPAGSRRMASADGKPDSTARDEPRKKRRLQRRVHEAPGRNPRQVHLVLKDAACKAAASSDSRWLDAQVRWSSGVKVSM